MSVNKIILVGNIGKDGATLRYTAKGTAVASFSLATNERYKDRDGNPQEKVSWHRVVAWRQLAEICGKFLTPGKQVYIEGKLEYGEYENKDGVKIPTSEIVADQMQFLGSKSDAQGRGDTNTGARRESAPRSQHGSGTGKQQQDDGYPFSDDEQIPF